MTSLYFLALILLSLSTQLTFAQYGYYYGPQRYSYSYYQPQATMFYRNYMPSPYTTTYQQPYTSNYNNYGYGLTGYQQPYNNYGYSGYQQPYSGYNNGYNGYNYGANNNYYSNSYSNYNNGYSSYYPTNTGYSSYPTSSFMGVDSMTYPNRGGNGMANMWLLCSTCTRG